MIADGFYNMDCFDGFKQMDDKSVDMILCDLPYGTTQCKWDIIIPFDLMWENYNRIIKDNGAICLFGAEPFTSMLICSNISDFKYNWIWIKDKSTGHLNCEKQPLRNTETISVFYKKQCKYNPQLQKKPKENIRPQTTIRKNTDVYGNMDKISERKIPLDMSYPNTTLYFRGCFGDKGKSFHPTQKPVDLLEYLINTYTDVGDLVLDNCAGSCSTGIAAHDTGRRFIGFEKDKSIFDLANERLQQHKSQMTLFDFGIERMTM